jgi:hypothetical protein
MRASAGRYFEIVCLNCMSAAQVSPLAAQLALAIGVVGNDTWH